LFGARRLHDLVKNVRIDRRDRFAIEAGGVLDNLVGHDAVALAGHDVEHGLNADKLAEGRRHPRIAEVAPHLGSFA